VDRAPLYRFLTQNPDALTELRVTATGSHGISSSDTPMTLAWREGRRSFAAEWIELFEEAEKDVRDTDMGRGTA